MNLSKATFISSTINTELLFNKKFDCESLNSVIEKDEFPCLQYIIYLNYLLSNNSYKDIDYKKIFYNYKDKFEKEYNLTINKGILLNDSYYLFSKQACINLIERIFKFGKFKNNEIYELNTITEEKIAIALSLIVFEVSVDENQSEEKTNTGNLNIFLSIITYNQFSNDINNSNYLRLSYLYDNYIKKHSDILKEFEKKNGYSIISYLLFLHIFFLFGARKNAVIADNIIKDNKINKCISDHIFNLNVDKNSIIIDSYIPSEILIQKPLIKIKNNYIIINPCFLMSKIHTIFFNKIKKSINNNAVFNKKFYGPLFENYIRDIARINFKNSNYKYYHFTEPFTYKIKNLEKESSDFYVTFQDICVIFEVKSTQRYADTTTIANSHNDKLLLDEINKKIVEPLNQIENRLSEIMTLTDLSHADIINAKEYYYIIVSDEVIPNNFIYYNDYLINIKPKYSNYLPLYLNISEFEYMLMGIKKRKKSIKNILEKYYRNYYNCQFTDMIIKELKSFKFQRLDLFNPYPFKKEIERLFNNE